MIDIPFFDSLTHASRNGCWLGKNHFNASLDRLLMEARKIENYKACLVNIAGYQDNNELESIALQYPNLFVPIAGFDPSKYESISEISIKLKEISCRRFAGIKLHPRLNKYNPLSSKCLFTIQKASESGLIVFLDTLFRQMYLPSRHTADIIDKIAFSCPDTKIVLLHGGGTSMLDVYEIVRMRKNLLLDISFSMMRYKGSSLDLDIKFIANTLDERVTLGSDFPEYVPEECRNVAINMMQELPLKNIHNIFHGNLERFFEKWI
ncbi:metal-dependent hydrolase [Litchfieldella qijiaojingensis]|uniref:Metal-dependent hydrolase n=1 Tax=Litchfieldella qijiaojingensis TaxID=980347 RepID=A0ABQ2Z9W5_9GAMM|nr:amidohydrolase family protein [Halomonas qijiaojingensis]GGY06521.1 metal-dependent hydrolase [Halomonas qijiaojingensis]